MFKGSLITSGIGELHLHCSVSLCSYGDVRTHIKLNNVVIVKISCFVPCFKMKIVVCI